MYGKKKKKKQKRYKAERTLLLAPWSVLQYNWNTLTKKQYESHFSLTHIAPTAKKLA